MIKAYIMSLEARTFDTQRVAEPNLKLQYKYNLEYVQGTGEERDKSERH